MSIYKKLHEIQKSVRGFAKDKKGHGYDYVSGEKVLSTVRSKMDELGVILKQEIISIDNERIDYRTGIGTTYEKPKSEILSKVMMKFTWVDIDTGDKDENSFGANGQNDWDKGVGSAMTYGERYFILKYFHIPTDQDDIDNLDRSTPTDQDDKAKKPKSTTTLEEGKKLIESAGTVAALTEIYNENQHLHVNKEFTEALTSKKKKLNGK
ncbi:ERF family protein [Sphingobacterium corticis]|uniref:ERF family protein n=1 Tax=Sphingobacterium corticis TaxID=1812823 RepID=A0ABW5NL72_9SPHI